MGRDEDGGAGGGGTGGGDGGTSGGGGTGGGNEDDARRLGRDDAARRLERLDAGWSLDEAGTAIERTIDVKGFAKATYLANLAAFHADRRGHHPDIAFGWGYCRVRYTTHDAGGLTEADFDAAAGFDRLLG